MIQTLNIPVGFEARFWKSVYNFQAERALKATEEANQAKDEQFKTENPSTTA